MIGHVLLRSHRPVTRRQDVEVELLDASQRVHPVRVVRIGEGAEGQAPGRYEIDREQRALLGEEHHDRVVRVVAAHVDELDLLAAELQRHAVREGDVGHRGRAAFADDRGLGPLVRNHRRGVGEDLAAGAVVGVVVAEDEVLDGPVEPLVDLGFEPGGRLRVDGVGGDHPLRCHQEDGEVEVVLKAVEVACDVGDGAFGLSVKRAGHEHERGEARGGAEPR